MDKKCTQCGKTQPPSEFETEVLSRGKPTKTKTCKKCRKKRNAQRKIDTRKNKAIKDQKHQAVFAAFIGNVPRGT